MTDQSPVPSRAPIDSLREAIYAPMALRAAMQLDIFTPLADGPMTAAALAEALDVKPRRLELLLYQLVVMDFLQLRDGRFANTEISDHYLVKGKPTYIGGMHGAWSVVFRSLMETAESIRTDTAQTGIDFAAMSQDELGGFLKGLHGATLAAGRDLAKQARFSQARNMVDVGGGSGGLAIALCMEHPQLHATVVDLPSVVPIAAEMIDEAGLSNRITVSTVDVVEEPLEGSFDIAVARSLFQVLSAEQCEKAARNIGSAVAPGGTLFMIGFVTDDSRISPPTPVGMNVVFVSSYAQGQAYAESDYRHWLTQAGFGEIAREPYLAGNSLISARKP